MEQDPLSDLLLDAAEVDRARLARALRDILGVDTESGCVVPKPGFSNLSTRNRVLAYLLGKKAAMLLGKAESEAVSPKDIPGETGMPSGTVYPKLKELREARLVSQTESSAYYVASHQILKALGELEKGSES